MGLEDLKRWHWVLIGLLLGAALGYARVWLGDARPPAERVYVSQEWFEQELRKPPESGLEAFPRVKDIEVRRDGGDNGGHVVSMQVLLRQDKHGLEWDYRGRVFRSAGAPYKPLIAAAGAPPGPDYTVLDYLRDVSRADARVTFRYVWWDGPIATVALWTAGTVLVVGGVWPTVVSLLVGAGFGRAGTADSAYDLGRFKGETPRPATASVGVSGMGPDGSGAMGPDEDLVTTGPPADTTPVAPVRALDGLEPVAAAPQGQQEEKDYRGEFYPVAREGPAGRGNPPPKRDQE